MDELEMGLVDEELNEAKEEAFVSVGEEEGLSDSAVEDKESDDELLTLKAEIDALKQELQLRDEREKASARMLSELSEFGDYFPEVDIYSIPEEIWNQVKNGASLSASYALNLRKIEIERKRVNDLNEKNRRMSTGAIAFGEGEKYYSPNEVKKMTPAQVKSHYDEIVESMRHWN